MSNQHWRKHQLEVIESSMKQEIVQSIDLSMVVYQDSSDLYIEITNTIEIFSKSECVMLT